MTEQIAREKKQSNRPVKVTSPSKKLLKLLDSLIPDFKKLQVKVDVIFKQARAEGFPDEETGAMIRMRMDDNYSERTIRRVLPGTAKREYNANPDVTNEKDSDKMSEAEPEAVYQMNPQEYRSEDLEQYDKPFLCEIIRYLEKKLGV